MKPVTIRYFGLVSMRKRTYLILQSIIFFVALALLVWVLTLPANPRFGMDPKIVPPISAWILDHLLIIVLFATFLEILDAFFTLRAFARKEKEEQRNPQKLI